MFSNPMRYLLTALLLLCFPLAGMSMQNVGGTWVDDTVWIKSSGVWVEGTKWAKIGGVWTQIEDSGPGPGVTKWYGSANVDGVPEPIGDLVSYGASNSAGRVYGRELSLPSGSLKSINIYRHTTSWSNGVDYLYGCVYADSELIGITADLQLVGGAGAWIGYQTLNEVSPGSLDYSAGTIRASFCSKPVSGGMVARDADDPSTINLSSTAWADPDPPNPATFTNSSSTGLLIILEVEE